MWFVAEFDCGAELMLMTVHRETTVVVAGPADPSFGVQVRAGVAVTFRFAEAEMHTFAVYQRFAGTVSRVAVVADADAHRMSAPDGRERITA